MKGIIINYDGNPVVVEIDNRGVAQGVSTDRDDILDQMIEMVRAIRKENENTLWGNDLEVAEAALDAAKGFYR